MSETLSPKPTRAKPPKASPTLDMIDVTALKGVGKQFAEKLAKLGLTTIQDLIFHLPLRYMDRTKVSPIASLGPNVNVVIEGEVKACDVVMGRRRSLMCRIQDGTGTISLRFFHFSAAQRQGLQVGTRLRCFGETRRGSSGLEIYHPEYEPLDKVGKRRLELDPHLTAVYPATEGLTQQRMRGLAEQALAMMDGSSLRELLPANLQSALSQSSLCDSLRYLHSPPQDAPLDLLLDGKHPHQQRLAFEELLAHHLSLLRIRRQTQQIGAFPLPTHKVMREKFLQQLPFALTSAQDRVSREIAADLAKPIPMLRLVQGDVGSGKTVVAALAAVQAIANGKQVAVMAPTEILAEQHRVNFCQWFEPLGIDVAWLSGKIKGKARVAQLQAIASGDARLIVGTHALFQADVVFADLGLSIIDEQHRFGVHQRLSLREKGEAGNDALYPHQLTLTATPIPRTLAMSAYADLDCSVVDELPPGRTPVATAVIANDRRDSVKQRVNAACEAGRQAYWVCTLIEESETLEAQAAEATAEELRAALPNIRIGLIHGRLKPKEKEAVMADFKQQRLDLLVATTVIEVGVDVPNASLMIIENPERLGLAQLHQLRGRVGRGKDASHCVLLYSTPLSQNGRERLKAMRETNDGFKIAEIDLQLRGPGEVLGTRQTGDMQFKIADLIRDADLLPQVEPCAQILMAEHDTLTDQLIRRWLGYNGSYANV